MLYFAAVKMCFPVVLSFLTFFASLCSGADISFTIQEEIPSQTLIGNIATEAKLAKNLTADEFGSLTYAYIGENKNANLFSIGQTSGALKTNVLIDREVIADCNDLSDCILKLSVLAASQKTNFFELITVSIHIMDINDQSPTFPQPIITLNISESSPVGSKFTIPAAIDKDAGPNGNVSYTIYPADGPFRLNCTKKLDGSFLLQIVQISVLDRETQEFYSLQIVAKDGGVEQNTGRLNVNVDILDINDNPPIFGQPFYNVTVREDVPPNTVILKVTAVDPDKGQNGQVSFQFSQVQTDIEKINHFFKIDSSSGEITLLESLIYEPNEKKSIIVEASDHGYSPQISQVKVNVNVEDVGNNLPVVIINLPSAGTGGVVMISEATNIDNFVAYVNVEDSDTGNNGNVSCSTPNTFFDVKKLPGTSKGFKVVVKQKLDREQIDSHRVLIICQDYGIPPMSAEASFNVTVTDENDNDPKFQKSLYEAYVDEGNIPGNPIVQVSAKDDDTSANAKVKYFLHSDAGSQFAINSETGVISASFVYDRETQASYLFHVLAVDGGDPPRTGTASVSVTIRDINDNYPLFNKTKFTFSVDEGQGYPTVVGFLQAYDKDAGQNGEFTISIAKEDEFNVPFVVSPTGVIKIREVLDREANSLYTFTVNVVDRGTPSLNSSAYVEIIVTDINDNAPKISFPKKGNNTVMTTMTSLPVTTILAEDNDIGINKKLTYYIFSGNEANMFYLNAQTGELFLNRQYSFMKDTSESIRVCVQDSGNPVLSDCADLNILVILSNSTVLPATSDSNKYITISIIVVIVTLLISAAIILTIYFLRKIDRNRQEQKYIERNGPLGVPMQNGYTSTENSTSSSSLPDSLESADKKRKEVSFSPGTSFDNSFQRSISSNSNEKQEPYLYDKQTVHHSQPYQDTSLQALKLKQILLKNNTETETRLPRPHPSDNHSDSSGETTTSDSGRGASEDEVPGSTLDDSRSFEFQYPSMFTHNQRPYSNDKINIYRNMNSDNRHTTRPISYNLKTNSAHITSNMSSSQPYLDNSSKEMQYHSWDFMRQSAYAQYPRKDRDYFNLRPESLSTLRSRDDDDDAATTTSGSYTINPEELDEDLFHVQKDLVV